MTRFSRSLAIRVKRLPAALVAAGAAALAAVAARAPSAAAEPRTDPRPLVSWSGWDSRVTQRAYHRVADAESWARVWEQHAGPPQRDATGAPQIPTVNFEACMVIAIFAGAGVNSSGVEIVSITEDEDRLLVRFDQRSYQTMSSGPEDRGRKVTDYGIFVLPRCDKEVVLEENVQGLIGAPPKWKERQRFAAR